MNPSGLNFLSSDVAYTAKEQDERDRFVVEYLKDYSAFHAAVRIGYSDADMALQIAKDFLIEPYVARAISNAERARALHLQDDESSFELPQGFAPHKEGDDKQRILSQLFKEAYYNGPGSSHSARVTALTTLAKLYKMDEKQGKAVNTNVMVVPAMGSVDDWEAHAAPQQEKLKQTVTE